MKDETEKEFSANQLIHKQLIKNCYTYHEKKIKKCIRKYNKNRNEDKKIPEGQDAELTPDNLSDIVQILMHKRWYLDQVDTFRKTFDKKVKIEFSDWDENFQHYFVAKVLDNGVIVGWPFRYNPDGTGSPEKVYWLHDTCFLTRKEFEK